MNKVKNIFIAFLIFGLVGCATLPPPKPLGPQRAMIGVSVKSRKFLGMQGMEAKQVYFIKVDAEGDLYSRENFIRSNYSKDGQVYLLNAKPGRYAVVACYDRSYGHPSSEYTTFFSKKLVKLTEVTVAPGTSAFMGEYIIDMKMFKDPDECQLHYCQLIAPGAYTGIGTAVLAGLTGHGEFYYTGSLHEQHCSRQDEIDFLINALEHLKGTDWEKIIQKRMKEVKAEK